jgi:large subunit ribosomal protein L21
MIEPCPGGIIAGASICIPNFPVARRSDAQGKWRSEDWRKGMKYAIVESGGKQYKAVEGSTIEVDLLELEAGQPAPLNSVLLLVDDGTISVGTPTVAGARVNATVVDHIKGPKVIIFKYRPKKRIRVKTGHRQQYTRLMIDSIEME